MVRLTLLPILYFLGTSFFVYAQQDREQQIDSLERILPASKDKGYIHFDDSKPIINQKKGTTNS